MKYFKEIIIGILITVIITMCWTRTVTIVINKPNDEVSNNQQKVETPVKTQIIKEKKEFPVPVDSIFLKNLLIASEGNKELVALALATSNKYVDNNVLDIICYDENCNVANHCSLRKNMGKTFFKKYNSIKECFVDFKKTTNEAKIVVTTIDDETLNKLHSELLISDKTKNNYKKFYYALQ